MSPEKVWALYNTLNAVLKQLDQTREPQLYANVTAAVSSAKDLLVQRLEQTGNT